MKSRLLASLLFVCFLFFSYQSKGQATCIAVIDSVRTEFCIGTGSVTFANARAVGENIEWITLGDGVFDNRFSITPTYTPGARDRSNGYAYILLDVFKDDTLDYCSELPWVRLNIGTMAAATPASQGICTGASIANIVLSSGLSGAVYSWTRDNTSTVTGIASSGTGNITGSLTNNTGIPVTVTFTITASNASCVGTPITATVTVSPRPNAVASVSSQSICSGASITPIVISGSQPGTVFNWTRNTTTSVTGISSSGSGNISGALTKRSGFTTSTVTFTITPNLNGCAGSSVTSTVAVSTSAVSVSGSPSSQTICSGTPISNIVLSGGTGTYSWTRNNTTSVTGIASTGTGNIAGTLNNITASPAYVTFTISNSSSSCANRATVLVNPVANVIASPASQSICSGAAIATISFTGNTNGTVYNWTRDNATTITGIASSGAGNINGNLVNTTNSAITVTFTVTPVLNGCAGTPVTVTVLVNPTPSAVAIAPASQTICSGTLISPISGNAASLTYNWVRDNITSVTGIQESGSGNIEGTLTNTGSTPATVTFTITPSVNGCTGTPVFATVNVNPRPTAILSGSQVICTGGASPSLSVVLTGAAPWSFTYTDGTTPVIVTGNNANPYTFTIPAVTGTYTLSTLSDANCPALPSGISGSAELTQLSYPVTASAGSNGFITPAGITNVNCGNNQTYFISAEVGFIIRDVLVDGVSVGAVSSYTFNSVTGAHEINAVFDQSSFTISASAGNNGNINPVGQSQYSSGSNITYSITANSCYQISDVLVDGISVGAVSTYTFTDVTAPHSISATFSQLSYVITATAGNNGSITAAGESNISCGNAQTYTITANSCYQISDVLVDGISVGAVSTYTFTDVTAPHSISATFSQLSHVITATAGNNGSITAAGESNISCGNSQTYSITANSCYQISDVLVDGVSVGAVSTYTFTDVTAPHSISATFSQLSYVITATAGTNGTVTPAGASNIGCGNAQTYTITPAAGFVIQSVTVDGVSAGTVSTYTFSNVTAPHSISASFTAVSACALRASATVAAMACNASTTTITVTTSGATGARQFSLNGGAYQSSNVFTVTAAGSPYVVTVKDGGTGCITNTNSVTVSAAPTAIPAAATGINGPATGLCSGGNFTYTVQPAAGATSYVWTAPSGFSIVSGQGSPQVVMSVPAGFTGSPGVWSVPKNACGGSAGFRLALSALQSIAPANIAGPTSVSAAQSGVEYSVANETGATYNWQVPTGASITAGQGSNSITVTFGNTSGNVSVAVTNACGTGPRTNKAVTVTAPTNTFNIVATAGSNGLITPQGTVAITAGNSQTYSITANSCYQISDVLVDGVSVGAVSTYTFTDVTAPHSISATFSQLSYVITATAGTNGTVTPAGASNIGCGNAQTYTITPAAGFVIQSVTVDGVSAGTVSTYTFSNVTAPHSISASFTAVSACALRASATVAAMACNASTTTITVTTSGATGARQFSLNGGAYQSSNVFTVTAAGSPYVVTVKDGGTGCITNTNSVTVSAAPTAIPAAATGINGPATGLCSGGNFTYTVQPAAGATSYVWTAPSGFSIVSGQGSPQVVMSVPAGFTGSPGVWSVPKNACGGSAGFRLALSALQSIAPANIAGPTSVSAAQSGVEYSVANETGATYNWQVPTGASITAGQGSNSITVTFGNTSGNVSVAVTNACGTGPRTNKAVSFLLTRPVSAKSNSIAVSTKSENKLSIYPNPAYNSTTIIFGSTKAGIKYGITICNSTGTTVYAANGVIAAGENRLQLDLTKFKNGIYMVKFVTEADSQTTRLIKGQ
jgi:ABC-type transporter MlaC component